MPDEDRHVDVAVGCGRLGRSGARVDDSRVLGVEPGAAAADCAGLVVQWRQFTGASVPLRADEQCAVVADFDPRGRRMEAGDEPSATGVKSLGPRT